MIDDYITSIIFSACRLLGTAHIAGSIYNSPEGGGMSDEQIADTAVEIMNSIITSIEVEGEE
jgi:hypothetical protein